MIDLRRAGTDRQEMGCYPTLIVKSDADVYPLDVILALDRAMDLLPTNQAMALESAVMAALHTAGQQACRRCQASALASWPELQAALGLPSQAAD